MSEFSYEPIFQYGSDSTEYRKLEISGVSRETFQGEEILVGKPEVLTQLTSEAFRDVNHLLRTRHLASLGSILQDPEASDNDQKRMRRLMWCYHCRNFWW